MLESFTQNLVHFSEQVSNSHVVSCISWIFAKSIFCICFRKIVAQVWTLLFVLQLKWLWQAVYGLNIKLIKHTF